MDVEEIFSMKYNELQKRAKSLGIKANMKIDKLRNTLVEHFLDNNEAADKQKPTTEKEENEEKTIEVKNKKKGPGRPKKEKVTKSVTRSPKPSTPTIVRTVRPGHLGSKPSSVLSPLVRKSLTGAKAHTTPKGTPRPLGTPKGTPRPLGTPNGTPRPLGTPKGTPKPLTPQITKVKSVMSKVTTPKAATPKVLGHSKQITKVKSTTPKVASSKPATPRLSTPKSAMKSATPNKAETPASLKRMSNQKRTPQETKRKRSTFEIVPLPDESAENQGTTTRRSTFVKKTTDERKSGSPGAKEMLGALTENMDSAEMKETLLSALDKKVQKKVSEMDPAKKTGIPRFAAFLAARKEAKEQKPLTPGSKNWTKIHKKQFDKMDSIDVYLNKKRKRQDEFASSAKKTKTLLEETKAAITKLKSHKTPTAFKEIKTKSTKSTKSLFVTPGSTAAKTKTPSGAPKTKTPVSAALKPKTPSTFKPTVFSTKNMNLDFNNANTRKSPRTSSGPFKPTVLSTNNMNLNFSRVKTPGTQSKDTSTRKSYVTPFKFNASINTTLDDSKSTTKKFDLKASLARPITWKTHKGKLKPLDAASMFSTAKGEPKVSVKTPKVAGRENRRAEALKRRADHKFDKQMSRRGINAQ
ncbi:nucleolar and spindle-associated protein 1-like isoform X2 [Pecten maximus]|uniref:nucleolar and spindle-associated protein 1-like isoform X2 n=1 Tax=Pecten maximus TaxID=6579 RepID=UPI001458A201|nr:nucleolar and spindle-associated protein 1-like isoform X2 [Pecten maximus]